MPDKRDECGCHWECTVLAHECPAPCRWPNCLTDTATAELLAELLDETPRTGHEP